MHLIIRFPVQRSSEKNKVWKYQSGNQKLFIKEEWTIQWPKDKEKIWKDKQWSTDHYTENKRSSNMNPTKNVGGGRAQVLRKGKQFLLHLWHPSCYCYTTRTSSDIEIVLDTNNINKTWIPYKSRRIEILFFLGSHSGHHNMELKTWRHNLTAWTFASRWRPLS